MDNPGGRVLDKGLSRSLKPYVDGIVLKRIIANEVKQLAIEDSAVNRPAAHQVITGDVGKLTDYVGKMHSISAVLFYPVHVGGEHIGECRKYVVARCGVHPTDILKILN